MPVVDDTWPQRLAAPGPEREAAAADLHGLLLRGARAEANRRRGTLPDAVLAGCELGL